MIHADQLSKEFGRFQAVKNASFQIEKGEIVGFLGPNGAGKTTTLRMLTGYLPPTSGTATIAGFDIVKNPLDARKRRGYLPEPVPLYDDQRVTEYLKFRARLKGISSKQIWPAVSKVVEQCGLDPVRRKMIRTLSKGYRQRVGLADALLGEPDLLILDEPTNHLDLLSLLWLQRYLKNYPGAILMISHDRDFMDELVESVYDIDNEELVEYRGNYSDFLKQRDMRFEQLQAAYRNQQKEIAHIQEFIDRFRSINSKAGQVQSRIKQLEKMKLIQKPVARRKVFKFNFPQPPRSTQKVIELEKICQSYGDHKVYENLDLLVERGERTVLVGPNGAGKSTLLKILAGIIPIDSGKRTPGTTTRIGYFSQARTENLNTENTVLEEIMKCNAEIREEEARSILGSFLFRRLDVEKRVSVLSGGEKSRLSLVKFLVDPPNLLLMDEPTTHLDLLSVEALVQALKHYEGTLVFISHDVHFIRSLAEKTLHVNRGTITTYAGGYDYYLEKSGILDDEKGGITAE